MTLQHLKKLATLENPVLLTGPTGFNGTWMTLLLERLGIPVVGFSLPPDRDSLYSKLGREGKIVETFADIRDLDQVNQFVEMAKPSALIHMAAQPLVLDSYKMPVETFQTNVMGTVNLLHANFSNTFFKGGIVITTDKVYRNQNFSRRFLESDPLEGKDPYSASKVATEAAVASWKQISKVNDGPNVITVRAGNVIGGGDYSRDRLIPDLIRGFSINAEIEIRSPDSTRPWQHVLDPVWGYLLALDKVISGDLNESLNFGPDEPSMKVEEVCNIATSRWPNATQVTFLKSDNALEAQTLELNSSKAFDLLNWSPRWNQSAAIEATINWWIKTIIENVTYQDACTSDLENFFSRQDQISNG